MQKYFYLFLLALVPVLEANALLRSSLSAIKQSLPCDLIPLCSTRFWLVLDIQTRDIYDIIVFDIISILFVVIVLEADTRWPRPHLIGHHNGQYVWMQHYIHTWSSCRMLMPMATDRTLGYHQPPCDLTKGRFPGSCLQYSGIESINILS